MAPAEGFQFRLQLLRDHRYFLSFTIFEAEQTQPDFFLEEYNRRIAAVSGAAAHQQRAGRDTRASSWTCTLCQLGTIIVSVEDHHTQTTTLYHATASNTAPCWSYRAEPFSQPLGNNAPSSCLNATLASLDPLICSEL